eukprot:jgi/Chlat1/7806/Chrsp66S07260
MASAKDDTLDKVQTYLAKRDGIDKVVKTIQYTCKLAHWYYSQWADEKSCSALAARFKALERSAGTSRKAFRLGRSLAGYNAIRHMSANTPARIRALTTLSNAGDMVYWFFDHFIWLSRVGFLHPHLESRFEFISAFGEALGYVFGIAADLIVLQENAAREQLLLRELHTARAALAKDIVPYGADMSKHKASQQEQLLQSLSALRTQRLMTILTILANLGDLVIALNDIYPGTKLGHALTLTVGGFTSAWCGAYKNWPR